MIEGKGIVDNGRTKIYLPRTICKYFIFRLLRENYLGIYFQISSQIWNFGAHAQDSSCIWLKQLQENCADFPEQLFYKKNGQRIVNGTVVDIGEIQWQAHLATKEGYWKNGFCGGTLLCDRFVLTAAHCIFFEKPEVVILGDHKENENDLYERRIDVKKIIIHPKYNNINFNNDIAILQLAKPVRKQKGIRNACLPKYEPKQQEVKEMLITGWGRKYSGGPLSNVLLKAIVDLVSRKKCKEMYGITGDITERMICAASPGKDTCQGDSGGIL